MVNTCGTRWTVLRQYVATSDTNTTYEWIRVRRQDKPQAVDRVMAMIFDSNEDGVIFGWWGLGSRRRRWFNLFDDRDL